MGKYRKTATIEAHQWFKNGDHPNDGPSSREGVIVRYFRRPDKADDDVCDKCSRIFHNHGWIDTLEGGHIVCPGDWIATGIEGEHWPIKPSVFAATYEVAEGAA